MLRQWMLAILAAAVALPAAAAPEHYVIDSAHTYPSLEFPHMGFSIWRGKFNKTEGSFVLDEAAKTGQVDIKVDVKSIDFGHDEMNEHAVDKDWLDAKKYPTMTYTGKLVYKGEKPVAVDGKLTLRGVTKPLKLKINSFNCMPHPFYKKRACGADAEGELNRADYGMTQYTDGGMGIIKLRIQAEALIREKKANPKK